MNIQRILFPTDFSQYNDAALKLASSLAAESQAKLYIIYVHDVQNLSVAMGEASFIDASTWREELREAEEQLGNVVPSIAGVDYKHECLTGNPVLEILKFAESHDIDLIVMASHGRTGLLRLLMGSVAETVMRKAFCPILIVKQPNMKDELHKHDSTSDRELQVFS